MIPPISRKPAYIAIDVTYRCPARCSFCFLKNNGLLNKKRGELTLSEIKHLISAAGRPKKNFYITGGEPLARKDILAILAWVKTRGHRFTLTTNGILLDNARIRFLAACAQDNIVISLHGDRAVHDRCLGLKGAFEKVTRNLQALISLPGRRCQVSLWCTINKHNFARLFEFSRLFLSLGVDRIDFNHLEFIDDSSLTRSSRLWKDTLKMPLALKSSSSFTRGINTKILAAQIEKIKDLGESRIAFDPDLPMDALKGWYDPRVALQKPKGICSGQWNALWISPFGDVLSCQPIAQAFGNIRTHPVHSIYTNKEYRRFRKTLRACGGFFPLCGRCGRTSFHSP